MIAASLFVNLIRSRRKKTYSYQNSLLSDSIFIFIKGPESIFYFSNYWNNATQVLVDHGYNSFESSLRALPQKLSQLNKNQQIYLICSPDMQISLQKNLEQFFRKSPNTFLQIHTLDIKKTSSVPLFQALIFRLHTLIKVQKNLKPHHIGLGSDRQWQSFMNCIFKQINHISEKDFERSSTRFDNPGAHRDKVSPEFNPAFT